MFYAQSTKGFYDVAIHGDNIPADAVEITRDDHATLLAAQSAGKRIEPDAAGYPVAVDPPPPPPPTAAQIIATLTDAVQRHLDTAAQARNYDSILSLCSYAGSAHTKFGPEGRAGALWRDAVWAKCYAVLADVQAGLRTAPTADGLIAELPALVWPI